MNRFKKWLIPVALVSLLLATLIGCSGAPASLGEIFDPSGNPFANRFSDVKDIRTATFVVAASDSVHKYEADYFCNGTNDHVQIQAAIDALPATGGEVLLLDGTYNVEVQINLDSKQTLRGCGKNTILITITGGTTCLSAVGASGTEKEEITIADLQIGDSTHNFEYCIYFEYVDKSIIRDVVVCYAGAGAGNMGVQLVYSDYNLLKGIVGISNTLDGIKLNDSTHNTITGCFLTDNHTGIYLVDSDSNIIKGNQSIANDGEGICIETSDNNVIDGNICELGAGGGSGIKLDQGYNNIISGNLCLQNDFYGIYIVGDNNIVIGNDCRDNSQIANGVCDDIRVNSGDHNNIQGNTCRAGALANKPAYGINIVAGNENLVANNDLYDDGFVTASFNDAGTDTKLPSITVPFSDGFDAQDSGYLIDANTEYARAWTFLNKEVTQVVRMKVYARSAVLEADKMRAEFVIYGASDNQVYTIIDGSVANHPSTSANFAADDVIYWTITTAGVLSLLGGDSVEIKVLHEIVGNGDIDTQAYFRTVTIEYV